MPYCRHCSQKVDKDRVSCPTCGESLVGEDTGWEVFRIQEKVEGAKHRANMYAIWAIVLVTMGLVGGGVLCVSSSSYGLFGIVLVCLGVGCSAAAGRYENKARNLKKQLRQAN